MKPSQKLEIRSPCRFPGTWSERSGDFQTRHGRHHFRGPRRSFPGLRWASCGVGYLYRLSLHCCGLMVSYPGPCASSGGRLPEALFMVVLLDSKGAKVCGSDSFFSGAVCFVRRTLARSAFHGSSIGLQRCKNV